MKMQQVQDYVLRFLEATRCQIIEKQRDQITVKLSPEADRALTNRPYYWSFVERTGAEPETMMFTFRFNLNPEQNGSAVPGKKTGEVQPPPDNTILGRFLGISPGAPQTGRAIQETVTFGSRRLQQIFAAASQKGKYVHLFEQPPAQTAGSLRPVVYSSWLNVTYKVELACDMKRDELHSLGICLSTGEIADGFFERVKNRLLTPKIPVHTTLKETISLQTALIHLEKHLENRLKTYDYTWADEAKSRMEEELDRIASFYQNLEQEGDSEEAGEIRQQHENRKKEIRWQYEPRIQVSVLSGGLFHLLDDSFSRL